MKTEKQFMMGDFAFINGVRPGHMLKYAWHHEALQGGLHVGQGVAGAYDVQRVRHYGRVGHRFAIFFLACQHGWKEAQGEAKEEIFATAFDRFVAEMKKYERQQVITDPEDV